MIFFNLEQNTKLQRENEKLKYDMKASQESDLLERLNEQRVKFGEMEELIRTLKRENQMLKVKAGAR